MATSEIGDFLVSRRAKIRPDQAGLIGAGSNRRVPGLRREEVATLAGVSVDYYARLERGTLTGVSDEVLAAVARALHLDDAESAHLTDLARAHTPGVRPRRRTAAPQQVRPSIQRFLDAVTGAPAWVRNDRLDFVAANPLARALYSPVFDFTNDPANNARFTFLDPKAHDFYPEWERSADDIVAALRGYAGRNPEDRALTDMIGELATRSAEFGTRWASHNVRHHRTGTKKINHPHVGALELHYEAMEMIADPGLTFCTSTVEPTTASHERMQILSNVAATTEAERRSARQSAPNSRD
ncbi:helix-turn-helix domain-containing protein [Clavibacter michiganensis subsp. phaseoli]|uniref:Helix-turn-helix domain-containing protein n=1 Tax=Clavibacter phaseoli TaxID=1734031 RepID=A0A8I0VCK9_9MICO|nr:helix-turn-helix transcriptional regulator [Clavibacter phaseoli]MBF4632596.1 helix-turn-helix domain-containing protein [Clavibacter phaseoli]